MSYKFILWELFNSDTIVNEKVKWNIYDDDNNLDHIQDINIYYYN